MVGGAGLGFVKGSRRRKASRGYKEKTRDREALNLDLFPQKETQIVPWRARIEEY